MHVFFIWTSDEESNQVYWPYEFILQDYQIHFRILDHSNYWSICLHSTSCHPRHCNTSIAYSQALRLLRICSNDSDILHHLQVLKKHLVSRGHSSRAVDQTIKKVKSMPRLSVLSEKPTIRDGAIRRFLLLSQVIPLTPHTVRQITSADHHILHTSDHLHVSGTFLGVGLLQESLHWCPTQDLGPHYMYYTVPLTCTCTSNMYML